jgi:fatty-acyl-CoA synthase
MMRTFHKSLYPAEPSDSVLDTTVGGVLREAAAAAPDQIALVEGLPNRDLRRRWTFAQLLAEAERFGRVLRARFEVGERVALWAPNIPEWVIVEFGAALAGVVLVTVNPAYRARELKYVLEQSGASAVLFVPEHRGFSLESAIAEVCPGLRSVREVMDLEHWDALVSDSDPELALPAVAPDDPAQIQYTSGTTGFPKGALLSHRSITNNSRMVMLRGELTADDVWINPMPMFHTGGCVIPTLGTTQLGATHVLAPYFDPHLLLDLIEQERGSAMLLVPTMLIAMLEHESFPGRDLSSVRVVVSGGSTVPAELVKRVEREFGASLEIIYGQTEASPVITQIRLSDSPADKSETVGQPLPRLDVGIVDPATGDVVPVGDLGEICARGHAVMLGYFDMPDKSQETVDEEGWLHTGDLGTMDERGYFRVTGRLKDMIIRGGENIYPREIEDVLFADNDVAETAVVGIPDAKWGETVVAFIRPRQGCSMDPAQLVALCQRELAPHKTPRQWVAVTEFPLTPSGKIQKFVLRDRLLAGEYQLTETA